MPTELLSGESMKTPKFGLNVHVWFVLGGSQLEAGAAQPLNASALTKKTTYATTRFIFVYAVVKQPIICAGCPCSDTV